MNLLDIILIVPLAWGAYKGFKRGFVFEVLMLVGLIIGLYVAFKFSGLLHGWVSSIVDRNSAVLPVLSFTIVFGAVLLIMILLARFLEGILKITGLQVFNQVAGSVLGVVKFALVVSVVLWLLKSLETHWNFINPQTKKESLLYEPVLKTASFITPALQDIRDEFREAVGSVKNDPK